MNRTLRYALFCICCWVIAAKTPAASIPGTFALQGEVARTSAVLSIERSGSDPLVRRFDIVFMKNGSQTPIRSFDIDMTKTMHMIIVNDDFTLFLHVHPTLQKNGHFVLTQRLPFPGLYHMYADTHPHDVAAQQVFRFDVPIGSFRPAQKRDIGETNMTANVQGYTVSLSTNTAYSGTESMIGVRILKDGKPATDLHPYLGAPAHAVFVNVEDLTYAHVHPMPDPMGGMMLHVALSEPGTYKLWLQFMGGNQLIVAPFIITAQ
jgi:hypothetical protein